MLGWMAAGDGDLMRVLPWHGTRQPLVCGPDGTAWFVAGALGSQAQSLVQLRVSGADHLVAHVRPLPAALAGSLDKQLTALDAGSVAMHADGVTGTWDFKSGHFEPLSLRVSEPGLRLRMRPGSGDAVEGTTSQVLVSQGRQSWLVDVEVGGGGGGGGNPRRLDPEAERLQGVPTAPGLARCRLGAWWAPSTRSITSSRSRRICACWPRPTP